MKKMIASLTGMCCLMGLAWWISPAWSQGQGTKEAAADIPHKVGLVDLGYIFKEYKKFDVLREDLKVELQESETKAKGMAEAIQAIQNQIKGGDLKEGSPEYIELEKKFTQKSTEFESFRKVTQKEFVRKESKLYQTIYLEVADAVEKFCKAYNYTMIMRFSREDLAATNDPQKLLQGLNKQVVYFRPEDDITDSVLEFLNRKYSGSKPAAAPASASPGTTPRTPAKSATKQSGTRTN